MYTYMRDHSFSFSSGDELLHHMFEMSRNMAVSHKLILLYTHCNRVWPYCQYRLCSQYRSFSNFSSTALSRLCNSSIKASRSAVVGPGAACAGPCSSGGTAAVAAVVADAGATAAAALRSQSFASRS